MKISNVSNIKIYTIFACSTGSLFKIEIHISILKQFDVRNRNKSANYLQVRFVQNDTFTNYTKSFNSKP